MIAAIVSSGKGKEIQGGTMCDKKHFCWLLWENRNESRNCFSFLKERTTNITLCFRFSKLFCHFGKRKTEFQSVFRFSKARKTVGPLVHALKQRNLENKTPLNYYG